MLQFCSSPSLRVPRGDSLLAGGDICPLCRGSGPPAVTECLLYGGDEALFCSSPSSHLFISHSHLRLTLTLFLTGVSCDEHHRWHHPASVYQLHMSECRKQNNYLGMDKGTCRCRYLVMVLHHQNHRRTLNETWSEAQHCGLQCSCHQDWEESETGRGKEAVHDV